MVILGKKTKKMKKNSHCQTVTDKRLQTNLKKKFKKNEKKYLQSIFTYGLIELSARRAGRRVSQETKRYTNS